MSKPDRGNPTNEQWNELRTTTVRTKTKQSKKQSKTEKNTTWEVYLGLKLNDLI